ncbi:MAG: hypothetical protein HUK40_00380 [Desulfobacter sp.]|nr:hypothetical protein [Desulfobacter sp.]WDP85700.1 MAG: hypothetical protein HUN05_11640 [Desulfobacter sp.]
MKPLHLLSSLFILLVTFAVIQILPAPKAHAEQKFAVLPFTIHAQNDLDFVKKGISRMLYSRISWPGKVRVIAPEKMDSLYTDLKGLPTNDAVKKTAQKTQSQFVLAGSVTQLAGAFSIDARVFDMENKRYMAFFKQSKNQDELIKKVDEIAATINQRVFERNTATWEQMEQEKQDYINDLKRKNPEHLMQVPAGWQPKEEIGWKVWKYLF